jgi:predicted XRE-type DNA-binding protein
MGERETTEDIPVTPGSGNVFTDLGFPNAEEELLKADLVHQIIRAMEKRRLTEAQTATILGISPSDVSGLIRGQCEDLPVDRLLRFLTSLGIDVEIVLTQSRNQQGGTRITIA